ncbi:MAG: phytanoyl-CoA dioxygenase family protein, partial [Phycisphaeraceae bacterium]
AWIDRVRRYIEVDDHLLRIDECFLNVRRRGGYIGIHSGGHNRRFTGLFRWHTGQWAVGQINVLMALTDVGPGDGCTTIIPGSHKSHEKHPFMHQEGVFHKHGGNALAMREVHMNAGDVIMFADGTCHGSIERTNPGERRVLIYRYAPHLLASRYNYLPSEELMARLTPERRRIVMPVPPRMRPGRTLEAGAYEK